MRFTIGAPPAAWVAPSKRQGASDRSNVLRCENLRLLSANRCCAVPDEWSWNHWIFCLQFLRFKLLEKLQKYTKIFWSSWQTTAFFWFSVRLFWKQGYSEIIVFKIKMSLKFVLKVLTHSIVNFSLGNILSCGVKPIVQMTNFENILPPKNSYLFFAVLKSEKISHIPRSLAELAFSILRTLWSFVSIKIIKASKQCWKN